MRGVDIELVTEGVFAIWRVGERAYARALSEELLGQ